MTASHERACPRLRFREASYRRLRYQIFGSTMGPRAKAGFCSQYHISHNHHSLYVDPDFLQDRRMKKLDSMTLSYTFFKSNEIYS